MESAAPSPGAARHPLPQGGRGEYERIDAALAEHGLMARGGFHSDEYPTLILAGTAGSAFWPHFAAGRRDESHPLDSWTRRTLTEVAGRFGAHLLMACDGPPFLPFQRWAMAAEPVYSSPMGVLVHPRYGLWHSWRGALVFDRIIDLPEREDAPNPCESCADRPCAAGCPVGAAAPYDVPRCLGHLKAKGECRSVGCLARHACPLGQDFAYGPEHAAFHMDAFVNAVWG